MSAPPLADPLANLAAARARLSAALADAGRADETVAITIAAKTQGPERLQPLLAAGCRLFGENRVQEAAAKWPALRAAFAGVELRLIGPLQSNKAREAVALFDVIESLDRPKLARALAAEMDRQGRRPRILVQVNTGEEAQKSGVAPREADALIAECRALGLAPEGLMCIPPADEAPAPHFALLAKIARRNGLDILSMGMSSDYEIAARLGATHVRLGTAIFGARPA